MQYHYVVLYDTDRKGWPVEYSGAYDYFPDGHVWDASQEGSGFRLPEVGPEDGLDEQLLNTLHYIVDTFPIPKEYENV